ncbi:MAG: DUF3047 domain-containing protein [Pseudomonadota bacterium]
MKPFFPLVLLAFTLALGGCALDPAEKAAVPQDPDAPIPVALFEAGDALTEDWQKFDVWRNTAFRLVARDEAIAIRAEAEGASGLLARRLEIDTEICPIIEWDWAVAALPSEADLSSRAAEDMAAAIFVVFGDPGVFSNPEPVPTLRYAWTTETDAPDKVVRSPYFPATLRTISVRSGPEGLGSVVTERRNLRADYDLAYGGTPEDDVEVIALFIDSDHGEEPLTADFLGARVLCSEDPGEPSIF